VAISSDSCNEPCPGYPNGKLLLRSCLHKHVDNCGNMTEGLYSYIQIGEQSSVVSAATASSTITDDSNSDNPQSTGSAKSIATVTVNHGTTVVVTSFVPSEPTTTVSPTGPQGNGADSGSAGGLSSTGSPNSSNPSSQTVGVGSVTSSFWDSTGKVAGVFVVVGVIVFLLGIAILCMCRTRKRRKDEEKSEQLPRPIRQISAGQPVSRSASLLQLLGRREKSRHDDRPMPATDGNRDISRSPTNLPIPAVDQRLDPQSMMMIRFEDNDSRVSFRDEDDYSRRVWRVTNASDSDSVRSTEIGTGRREEIYR
jgi:cell wall integrity and stress response component